jgi:hypothetical protein
LTAYGSPWGIKEVSGESAGVSAPVGGAQTRRTG